MRGLTSWATRLIVLTPEDVMTVSNLALVTSALLLAACPALVCRAQDTAAATERFLALDLNNDNVISQYEYDSDAAFLLMDQDQNGRLSATELQAMLGTQEQGAVSAADRIIGSDLDKDGELSDSELRRSLSFRFQWLDRNKDGNVELSEFQSGVGVPMIRGK
jgi:Ca2+-binding EF-hand superfamily protein